MDSTTDGYRSFLDGGDIGVTSIWEYDGGVGSLHDDLEVDVSLAQHRGVMLGRDLHGHDYRHAASQAGAQVVHEQQGGLFHPGALPLTAFHHHCRQKQKNFHTTFIKNLEAVIDKYLNKIWILYWS